MGEEIRRPSPLGRIGAANLREWHRSLFVGAGAAFAALGLGLLVAAAVLRSLDVAGGAVGAAFGVVVMWLAYSRSSAYTVVYPYELVMYRRGTPVDSVARGAIAAFRITDSSDEPPQIVAIGIDGRRTRLVGSSSPPRLTFSSVFRPGRAAEESKRKLDRWLRDGHYE